MRRKCKVNKFSVIFNKIQKWLKPLMCNEGDENEGQ